MPSVEVLFSRLRRSVLGAWLATVYALSVIAAALTPAQADAAMFAPGSAVLCSGLAAPGEASHGSAGEAFHCQGCPASPLASGAEPVETVFAVARETGVETALPRPWLWRPAPLPGLAQARAPPPGAV